jgi:hypothetical protein
MSWKMQLFVRKYPDKTWIFNSYVTNEELPDGVCQPIAQFLTLSARD